MNTLETLPPPTKLSISKTMYTSHVHNIELGGGGGAEGIGESSLNAVEIE